MSYLNINWFYEEFQSRIIYVQESNRTLKYKKQLAWLRK